MSGFLFVVAIIIIACILAVIWFLFQFIAGSNETDGKDDMGYLTDIFTSMLGNTGGGYRFSGYSSVGNGNTDSGLYAGVARLIEVAISDIQTTQIIFLAVFVFAFVILVLVNYIFVWFIPEILGFFLNMLFGAAAIALFSFFAFRVVSRTLTRTLLQAESSKEDCLAYIYNGGFELISLLVAVVFGLFIIQYFLTSTVWGGELDAEGIQTTAHCLLGYTMGMVISAFVYREAVSLMARSLRTATFGVIGAETNLDMSNNNVLPITKYAYIVANQTGQIVVNFIDTALVIVFMFTVGIMLFSNSAQVAESEELKETHLIAPLFWLSLTYFTAFICSFFKVMFNDDEPAAFTALNIRWQVIFNAIGSFLIFAIAPAFTTVPEFTLAGEGTEIIDTEGKKAIAVSWCCVLGLAINILVICIYEWYTSHGCPAIRNMVNALAAVDRVMSMNLSYSNYLAELLVFIPLFAMVSLVFISFRILGFAGIYYACAGYMSTFIVFIIVIVIIIKKKDLSYHILCWRIID